jgi:hypothetical protein
MKKFALVLLALATALAITPAARADTWGDFNYTFTAGTITGTGIISGWELGSTNSWDITSGSLLLTGTVIDGYGKLVAVQSNGNFYTGGGTILTFNPLPDTNLYPSQNPQIDNNGALTWDITSGIGKGNGIVLWSNGPGDYGMFGGNWSPNIGSGVSFEATLRDSVVTPEPGSLLLLGTGLLGLAVILFRKAKPSGLVLNM